MSENEQEQVEPIKTVRMVQIDDGKTGDIHPDEVEHMKAHGWQIAEDQGTGQEQTEMTDDELRAAVEAKTGKAPHPNAGRETLLKKLADAE